MRSGKGLQLPLLVLAACWIQHLFGISCWIQSSFGKTLDLTIIISFFLFFRFAGINDLLCRINNLNKCFI